MGNYLEKQSFNFFDKELNIELPYDQKLPLLHVYKLNEKKVFIMNIVPHVHRNIIYSSPKGKKHHLTNGLI